MLLEYDGAGWIETLDYVPVKAYKKIQERKVDEALRLLVLQWSSIKSKVNLHNIRKLKYWIAEDVIKKVLEPIQWFLNIEDAVLERMAATFVKGLRPTDELGKRVAMEYLPMVGVCLNSKGDVIHFPVSGGYEDQPVDKIRFLTIYRFAVVEYINAQQRR